MRAAHARALGGERAHGSNDVLTALRALDLGTTTTAPRAMTRMVFVHVKTHSRESHAFVDETSLVENDWEAKTRTEPNGRDCSNALNGDGR